MCLCLFHFSNSRCLQIYNQLKSIESRLTKMMMETIFLYIIGQYSYYECRVYAMNKTFRVRVRRSPPRCCLFFFKVSAIQTNHFNCNRSLSALLLVVSSFLPPILRVKRVELICMSTNGNVLGEYTICSL